MTPIRSILSYTLFLALLSLSLCTDRKSEAKVDHEAFQKLLTQVDPPSLHAALHDFSPRKFKHGMFPEDRAAVEAIHREEPGIATGILKMAKLAKRQDNGNVTTTTPAPEETTTSPDQSTSIGPETSSSTAEESPSPSSSPSSAEATTTTTSSETSSITSTPSLSISDLSTFTSGQVVTTTDAEGNTIITTIGGGLVTVSASRTSSGGAGPRTSRTSTLLQTSTLPNGQRSTITAVTVVGGGGEGEVGGGTTTAGVGASGPSSAQPGLQTGEAAMTRGCGREMAVVLGAAVGVAFML